MEERWTAVFLGPLKEPWEGLREELQRYRIEEVLAADAGAILAQKTGYKPKLVIGDMDSLTEEERRGLEREGVHIECWPEEKDYTDFELILMHPQMKGVRRLIVVGGLGGRVDHTLLNIDMLSRRFTFHTLLLFPEGKAFILRPGEEMRMWAPEDMVVSVVPLTERAEVENSEGLLWPLSGMTLRRGLGRTVHNISLGGEIKLKLRRGRVIVILFKEGVI
ncbi:MAG: thiamine diphosphokinase [Thermoplasmata archaeon]|nr:MAG: thiamine diphosphokinase [Thermoplasmata archaeon]